MANQIENRECLVQCKHCGTVNTAIWKNKIFKHWSVKSCNKCNQKLEVNKMETVLCPHCGKLVEKTPQNLCLSCGKLIYREEEVFRAVCDNCGITNLIPFAHDEKVTCLICGHPFRSEQLKPAVDPSALQSQYIKLKDQRMLLDEDLIVYKHPMNSFPAGSRIQVNEGTWALVLQNGACHECAYRPESYSLFTSDEKMEKKLAAAATGENVVLDTQIFCGLKTLPEIGWGTPGRNLIQNSEGTKDYRIVANGSIVWSVTDAKAFMKRFGFIQLYGRKGILQNDAEKDGELIKDTRIAVSDALSIVCRNIIGLDNLDPLKLIYKQTDIEKQVTEELDRIMNNETGLSVSSFRIKDYRIEEQKDGPASREAAWHELIARAVERDYIWSTKDVRLYQNTNKKLYADYTFNGSARLKIADEKKLVGLSEIKELYDNFGNNANSSISIAAWFSDKLNEAVNSCAAPAVQKMIDDDQINIQELYMHTTELAQNLKTQIQSRLSAYGLETEAFYLNKPSFEQSDDLKREDGMEERRKMLIRYAEKTIDWEVRPFEIHMKNDKALNAKVSYSGNCTLKVTDPDRFYNQSEIDGYLHTDPFVDEKTVKCYYAGRISSHFAAKLSNITQDMIDEKNWDIRELARYTEELKKPVIDTLNDLISDWGMRVESMYLHNTSVSQSRTLENLSSLETHRTENDIEVSKNKIDNRTETEILQSDVENAGILDDILTSAYIHATDNEIKRDDADEKEKDKETEQTLNEIRRGGLIGDAEHRSRIKGVDNRTEMDVHTISGQIQVEEEQRRKDDLKKEHDLALTRREEEHKRAIQQICQQAGLDFAKFQETLNGIMHSIDASNLDWRKKLDEYNRLSYQLGVKDVQDARRTVAETDAEIMRTRGKANADVDSMTTNAEYERGIKGIQLGTAEAQLQETIDRYAEERGERIAAADYARKERAAVLSFQQDLEARKAIAEEQMAFLKEKLADAQRERDYDLRIADMKTEIEKLRLQLDAEKHKVQEEAGLGKVQSESEARVKEAEAKIEAEKRAAENARDDDMMNRAEALFRYVQEIQNGMDCTRFYMKMHADDNETSVRKEYAEVEKAKASGINEHQWMEIIRKLDELEKDAIKRDYSNVRIRDNEEYGRLLTKIRKALAGIDENRKSIDAIRDRLDKTQGNRTTTCWACRGLVQNGDRFCSNCGTRL